MTRDSSTFGIVFLSTGRAFGSTAHYYLSQPLHG